MSAKPRQPKQKLIVKEQTSLERDVTTRAILNRDEVSYHRACARKRLKKEQMSLISDLFSRVEALEKQVKALKKLDK